MSFSSDLQAWIEKASLDANQVMRSVATEIFTATIVKTPVDSGRLVNNWQVTYEVPAFGQLDGVDPDRQETINRAKSAVLNAPQGVQTLWLTNNLPYAYRVEYLGWSSVKAPAGMLRVSIAEYQTALRQKVAELT